MKHSQIRYSIKQVSRTSKTILVLILAYSGLLLMDYSTNHQHNGTICLFKLLTAYPCPGCGLGRATLALMHGDISKSFQYNILCIPITIAVVISLFWLITDLVRHRETFFSSINKPIRIVYIIPFFIITAITWYLNIIRGI